MAWAGLKVGSRVMPPDQDVFTTSATQKAALGTRFETDDGRRFVYCRAGGAELAVGKLCAQPAYVATLEDIAVATAAGIGDQAVTLTVTDAATANAYAEGWLGVQSAVGAGQLFKIKSNAAAASGASCKFGLYDQVRTALVAGSSIMTYIPCPYNGCIINAATATGKAIGIPQVAVTTLYYFWCQSFGPSNCLCPTATAVGDPVTADDGTAGGVQAIDAGLEPIVGYALHSSDGGDTTYGPIFLTIE